MMRRALSLALPLAVLALALALTDARAVAERLISADPAWAALALAALMTQTMLSARRWQVTAAALGQRIGGAQAVREYFVAQFVNQTLPGGVTGDALRAVRARAEAGLAPAAAAVALERLAGQVFMFGALALGMGLSLGEPGWPAGLQPFVLGVVALAAALFILLAVRPAWVGAGLRRALLAPAVLPAQIALGLAIVTLNLVSFAAAARATGTHLGTEQVLALVPLILCAMLVPFGLAGWGWREGAAAALFPLAGAAPAAGVAAGAAFGALCLAAALPGALWLVLRPVPLRQP